MLKVELSNPEVFSGFFFYFISRKCRKEKTMSKVDQTTGAKKKFNVRALTVTALLSAVAFGLMFLDFSLPIIPSFIKMDVSDLPELIGAFAYGPICGAAVALIKNLLHLFITTTGGVGELSNFMLGAIFVVPAGIIYNIKKSRTTAIIGSLVGVVCMGVLSIVSNYFITYPVYYNFMPKEVIVAAYQAVANDIIRPAIPFFPEVQDGDIMQCLVQFNMPFTMLKGLISVIITMLVYKRISPLLKGNFKKKNEK